VRTPTYVLAAVRQREREGREWLRGEFETRFSAPEGEV
jgi:hypothetical protein